ncbi:hypothetical protein [Mitsuaria sp. GD03876]|uniref:hypothetical protein n=1 Tax=Mitsuaria sp. GD03876 TaxID=2975399 RepID=UPI002448D727|nr:hypothetical protein [Mitsuaria sp. GD03876]MDH0866017.1 patatin-like phospholipase family protein [Mitsuaria sp. GD03876]
MVIAELLAHNFRRLRSVWEGLKALLRPAVLLWPWLLSSVAYAAFLQSSQGRALTWQMPVDVWRDWRTIAAVALAFAATLCACLLTSLVVLSWQKPVTPAPKPNAEPILAAIDRRLLGLLHIGWAFALSSAPMLMLSGSTGSGWPVLIAAALGLLVIAVLRRWILRGAWQSASTWSMVLRRLHGIRMRLAVGVGLLATAPLLVGAGQLVRAPDEFNGLGPVFIALLGLSALSSLFATLFIAFPYCTPYPRLVALLPTGLVVANVVFQPLADPVNPLLKGESACARALYDVEAKTPVHCYRTDRSLGHGLKDEAQRVVQAARGPEDVPALYFVNAEGGGIRAAYWTAMGLVHLEEAIPDFKDHIAVMSGVSGGSLGLATWLAAVEATERLEDRRRLIDRFLGSDLLSPAIAGLLFLDSPRLIFGPLWRTERRDDIFEAAVTLRWRKAVAEVLGMKDNEGADFFVRPLVNLCFRRMEHPPTIYFNATEVLWGAYAPLGNTNFGLPAGDRLFLGGLLRQSDILVGNVVRSVVLSARFPLLAPTADIGVSLENVNDYLHFNRSPQTRELRIKFNEGKLPEGLPVIPGSARLGVLVDGGYFDNSGLSMTRYALDTLSARPPPPRRWLPAGTIQPERDSAHHAGATLAAADAVATHVILFSNDPAGACIDPQGWESTSSAALLETASLAGFTPVCRSQIEELEELFRPRWLSWLSSPIETILAVRTGHAAHESKAMAAHLMARPRPSILVKYDLAGELSQQLCEDRKDLPSSHCLGAAGRPPSNWEEVDSPDLLKALPDSLREQARGCKGLLQSTPLPLGWSLHAGDRSLMRCLSANAALDARLHLETARSAYLSMGKPESTAIPRPSPPSSPQRTLPSPR